MTDQHSGPPDTVSAHDIAELALLRSAVSAMAFAVMVVDHTGRLVLSNPAACRLLGDDVDVMGPWGLSGLRRIYRSDKTTLFDVAAFPLNLALAGQASDDVEMYIKGPDSGDGLWINVAARPLIADSGAITGAVAAFSEITGRKKVEADLQRREEEFRALVEHSPDLIARYDGNAVKTYANPALASFIGIPQSELVGKTASELPGVLEDSRQDYERSIKQVFATGRESTVSLIHRGRHGAITSLQLRLVAELDHDGRVASVLSIGRDVTELIDTQRRLTTLLENMPDLVARSDVAGRYVYANPAFCRELNVPQAEALGHTAAQLGVDPEGALTAGHRLAIDKCLSSVHEVAFGDAHSRRFFEVRLTPEVDDTRRVTSVLNLMREVTERKRSEALVAELGFRREAAREDERRHIARELHDELGQLLSALKLEVSVMRARHGVKNEAIARQATSMLALVDSVLRVQRNLVTSLRPAVLDLGIEAAIEWLSEQLSQHSGIPCDLYLPQHALGLDDHQTATVFRIAQECLTNVQRHAHASHVEISLRRAGDDFVLMIHDDGDGFDINRPRNKESLGIVGMAERAQMLGGRLDIHSASNLGTSVTVRFPAIASWPSSR